jgi:uncharacterized protein (DUF427 family)
MQPMPDRKTDGQESVWDYPRPAIAEQVSTHLKIIHLGVTIAETRRGVRTLETSHPPSYYFPREDVEMSLLSAAANQSFCEWKGAACYFDISLKGESLQAVAWSYPRPTKAFLMLSVFTQLRSKAVLSMEKKLSRSLVDSMAVGLPQNRRVPLRAFRAVSFGELLISHA